MRKMLGQRLAGGLVSGLLVAGAAKAELSPVDRNLAEYAKGVFAELQGDVASARTHFEETLARDSDSFQVACKTANLQLADDDLPDAVATLRSFAISQPGHLPSQLYYTDFLEQHGARDAAAQKAAADVLEAANARFPHRPEVYSRLINLHENLGQREESLNVFNAQFEAEDAGPEHWMALRPIARTLLPGDSTELKERLDLIAEKMVETGAGIEMAARAASDYYRTTGRLEEAIAVLAKHVEIQPASLNLRTRLGLLQIYAGEIAAGLETLQQTLEIDPDQLLAHRALAQYYARNDEPKKALHHNAEGLRIAGGAPEDFLEVATQFLDLDQPHEARLLLERARFDHPEDGAIAARLAIATLRDGDTTAAARLFRQAEALAKESGDPRDAEYLDADFQLEFASSLREAGDSAAAESRLREAIRGIPSDEPKKAARALRELARLWIDQEKNLAPAVSLLNRADSLDPGNAETAELLERARDAK